MIESLKNKTKLHLKSERLHLPSSGRSTGAGHIDNASTEK